MNIKSGTETPETQYFNWLPIYTCGRCQSSVFSMFVEVVVLILFLKCLLFCANSVRKCLMPVIQWWICLSVHRFKIITIGKLKASAGLSIFYVICLCLLFCSTID